MAAKKNELEVEVAQEATIEPVALEIKSARLIETAYFKGKECQHFDGVAFRIEIQDQFIRISKPGVPDQVLLVPLTNVRSIDMA